MAFGAVRILDVNGLSYLYTKLNNNITDFQNTSKAIIDSAAAAANNAAQTYDIVSQLKQPCAVPAYVVPNPYCNCNSQCGGYVY